MELVTSYETRHSDVVQDIAYDYYGKRLASCSADQMVKIWDLKEEPSQTETSSSSSSSSAASSSASVNNNLAQNWNLTASWKAHTSMVCRLAWAHPEFGQVIATCSSDHQVIIWEEITLGLPWKQKATLVDHREAVIDTKFAPKHLGLKLATCSRDGVIRIYEAADPLNLEHWARTEEFESQNCNCLTWNPTVFGTPMMAVGNTQGTLSIYQCESNGKWTLVQQHRAHADTITDISWAPNLGRSYNLIATASKDKTVKIWKLNSKGKLDLAAQFHEHNESVWRVEWNITGTVLASSGDDGSVKLWKQSFNDTWQPVSSFSGQQ